MKENGVDNIVIIHQTMFFAQITQPRDDGRAPFPTEIMVPRHTVVFGLDK
jgi:hypothetical protein